MDKFHVMDIAIRLTDGSQHVCSKEIAGYAERWDYTLIFEAILDWLQKDHPEVLKRPWQIDKIIFGGRD